MNQYYSTLLRNALLSVLRQENMVQRLPSTSGEQRKLLGDVLIASNQNWKQETLKAIDELFEAEKKTSEGIVSVNELKNDCVYQGSNISIWQGDITKLQVDAIVNAANDQGLGCFQPSHVCIDNVIHRKSGPRLRLACKVAMDKRGVPLAAGTEPMLTPGFHLPAKNVIHVTAPQISSSGGHPTREDREALASAYYKSLDLAATSGLNSIVFPCISTGLFGFPADEASRIALSTTEKWLSEHPNQTQHVVFDVFSDKDYNLYHQHIGEYFVDCKEAMTMKPSIRSQKIQLAKNWIEEADAVLICAGAGMSVKEGEMVYTNPEDFAKAYPWFMQWGYHTSYEVMGLEGDMSVPRTAKWALYAKHMDNMRWAFAPNDGYDALLKLVQKKNYFVLTSNVDAWFERSGFSKDRIYTPQGEWTYLQCQKPCRSDSVFESRPYLDRILPQISDDGFIPRELIPKCPRCGSDMFGNVRAGENFLHCQYENRNVALRTWMQSLVVSNAKVAVIEIGAGFNTPTVTRFPVESFVRELGKNGSLIRINPTEAQVPHDLNAIALAEGWQVLGDILSCGSELSKFVSLKQVREDMAKEGLMLDGRMYSNYFGHFDWRRFLLQLKDRHR